MPFDKAKQTFIAKTEKQHEAVAKKDWLAFKSSTKNYFNRQSASVSSFLDKLKYKGVEDDKKVYREKMKNSINTVINSKIELKEKIQLYKGTLRTESEKIKKKLEWKYKVQKTTEKFQTLNEDLKGNYGFSFDVKKSVATFMTPFGNKKPSFNFIKKKMVQLAEKFHKSAKNKEGKQFNKVHEYDNAIMGRILWHYCDGNNQEAARISEKFFKLKKYKQVADSLNLSLGYELDVSIKETDSLKMVIALTKFGINPDDIENFVIDKIKKLENLNPDAFKLMAKKSEESDFARIMIQMMFALKEGKTEEIKDKLSLIMKFESEEAKIRAEQNQEIGKRQNTLNKHQKELVRLQKIAMNARKEARKIELKKIDIKLMKEKLMINYDYDQFGVMGKENYKKMIDGFANKEVERRLSLTVPGRIKVLTKDLNKNIAFQTRNISLEQRQINTCQRTIILAESRSSIVESILGKTKKFTPELKKSLNNLSGKTSADLIKFAEKYEIKIPSELRVLQFKELEGEIQSMDFSFDNTTWLNKGLREIYKKFNKTGKITEKNREPITFLQKKQIAEIDKIKKKYENLEADFNYDLAPFLKKYKSIDRVPPEEYQEVLKKSVAFLGVLKTLYGLNAKQLGIINTNDYIEKSRSTEKIKSIKERAKYLGDNIEEITGFLNNKEKAPNIDKLAVSPLQEGLMRKEILARFTTLKGTFVYDYWGDFNKSMDNIYSEGRVFIQSSTELANFHTKPDYTVKRGLGLEELFKDCISSYPKYHKAIVDAREYGEEFRDHLKDIIKNPYYTEHLPPAMRKVKIAVAKQYLAQINDALTSPDSPISDKFQEKLEEKYKAIKEGLSNLKSKRIKRLIIDLALIAGTTAISFAGGWALKGLTKVVMGSAVEGITVTSAGVIRSIGAISAKAAGRITTLAGYGGEAIGTVAGGYYLGKYFYKLGLKKDYKGTSGTGSVLKTIGLDVIQNKILPKGISNLILKGLSKGGGFTKLARLSKVFKFTHKQGQKFDKVYFPSNLGGTVKQDVGKGLASSVENPEALLDLV